MIEQVGVRCVGCGVCVSKCPQNCLSIISDRYGFYCPSVNINECVNCGLCDKSCPVLAKKRELIQVKKTIAVTVTDKEVLNHSSSGGAFYLLASAIINRGGYVCGAEISQDNIVRHRIVNNLKDLSKLLGSKYVQSDTGNMYSDIKKLLDNEDLVLFSGTPCQVNGLTAFLGRDYENLLKIDLICHGVSSPYVWKKYVEFQENKYHSKVVRVFFRKKTEGWSRSGMELTFENGAVYFQPMANDLYFKQFLSDVCLQDCCYSCEFKGAHRSSDITIGDFWGVEKLYPELYDVNGVSLLIANTDKGVCAIREDNKLCDCKEVDLKFATQYNSAYWQAVQKNRYRDAYIKELANKSFDKVTEKYIKKIKLRRRVASYIYKIKKRIKIN